METPIYFTDERWERIEKELSDIKTLLTKVLAAIGDGSTGEDDSILSAREVARQLSVDIATIYTKCADGSLPHFKIGKRYRFRQSEIDDWIKKKNENQDVDIDDYVNRYLQKTIIRS